MRRWLGHDPAVPFVPGERAPIRTPLIVRQEIVLTTNEEVSVVAIEAGGHLEIPTWETRVLTAGGTLVDIHIVRDWTAHKARLDMLAREAIGDTASWEDFHAFKAEFIDARLLYALTTHNAQRSTFRHVFVEMADFRYWIAKHPEEGKKGLYVAITRFLAYRDPGRRPRYASVPHDIEGAALVGFKVFPTSGYSRAAAFPGAHLQATDDLNQIARWCREYPRANWRLIFGPSALWGLDIDAAGATHSADGVAAMAALTAVHGALPPRPTSRSGGGGYGLIFRHNGERIIGKTGYPAPGIDPRRGLLSLTIPPSIHVVTRRPYRWARGLAPCSEVNSRRSRPAGSSGWSRCHLNPTARPW